MSARISSNPDVCDTPELFLPVAGIQPFTTIDFPGRLAAVIFTRGCAWRCRYCFNHGLQEQRPDPVGADWLKIFRFLENRRGLLEAVVFSGGEPTLHPSLGRAMESVKRMGFLVGLHTAGMVPQRLTAALPACDWVGMDFKAPFDAYERTTGVAGSGDQARLSADILIRSGVPYEFRTTYHPGLLEADDLRTMARELAGLGAKDWVIQNFRKEGCGDAELCGGAPVPESFLERILPDLERLCPGARRR